MPCVRFLCPLPGQTRPMTLHVGIGLQAWDLECCNHVVPSLCIQEQQVWIHFVGTLTCCLDKEINPARESAFCFPS